MKSFDEAIQERLTEIKSDKNEKEQDFATWLSSYIAEQAETDVDADIWAIKTDVDGILFPSLDVGRFVVETEQGWTEVEIETVETADGKDEDEGGADDKPGYVYGKPGDDPKWVIYAWKAYSGERYVVESHDSFLDACVCAKELGPYT